MNKIPWYQSNIIRQQVVQLVTAALMLTGVMSENIDVDQIVGGLFAGIAALTAVWTIFTRLFHPSPPITEVAASKGREKEAAEERARQ